MIGFARGFSVRIGVPVGLGADPTRITLRSLMEEISLGFRS